MNRTDEVFNAGFRTALALARVTADRIAMSPMPVLRKEMAAEALRAFAEEAEAALEPTDAVRASPARVDR